MASLPSTGVLGLSIGLPSDGLLGTGGAEVHVINSLSVGVVPDDGGTVIVATGVFPTDHGLRVYLYDDSGNRVACYGGLIGFGTAPWSTDGTTLRFIAPKFAVGGPYDVGVVSVDSDGLDTGGVTITADLLTVVPRSYTTDLYDLRRHYPTPRDPGAYDILREPYDASSIIPDELLKALVSAVADEIYEAAGFVQTRTRAAYTAGGGTLTVEGTDRFPDAGTLATTEGSLTYTGKTATTFTGVISTVDVANGTVVIDNTRTQTEFDQLRRAFYIATATSLELDVIGRSNGFPRPRGVSTEVYRGLLSIILYAPLQTTYALERALTVIYGAGNYEIWEDPDGDFPATVYISVPALAAVSLAGKSYLLGQEAFTTAGGTSFVVDYEPTGVYGVYNAVQETRGGANFIYEVIGGSTFSGDASLTARLHADTPGSYFTAGDEGKSIIVSGGPEDVDQGWTIDTVVDADSLDLVGRQRADATLLDTDPDHILTTYPAFADWMAGSAKVEIISTAEGNEGVYVISEVISPYEAVLTGAAFATQLDATWRPLPLFDSAGAYDVKLDRSSFVTATKTITLPNSLSAGDYWVDYQYVREDAQLRPDLDPRGEASPLYLFDHASVAALVAQVIVAAGVVPEFPIED